MRDSKRMRRRALTIMVAGMVFSSLLAGSAIAAPAHKSFTASITPDTNTAGTETDFDLTITNTSKNTVLGAVKVTVPAGFMDLDDVAVDRSDWSATDEIVASANSSQGRLAPGESVVISFTATTPLQDGDTDYTFTLDARQANKFNGPPGNGLNLVGGAPVVTVTGTAVACDPTCETNYSEDGTTAAVSSACEPSEDPCGILVTDLDGTCPAELSPCIGQSIFWKPPAGATEPVLVVFEVPADVGEEFDYPEFWVSFNEGDPIRCTLDDPYGYFHYYYEDEEPSDCTYTIELVDDVFVIEALVAPIDPRGFAS